MDPILQDLIVNVVVGAIFFLLGGWVSRRDSKRLISEMKRYLGEQLSYANRLRDVLTLLEGKNVEGEGRIVVDRDDEGNPDKVRIAPPQVIHAGSASLEAEVGVPTVDIGPPPTPPQSIGKDLPINSHVRDLHSKDDEGTHKEAPPEPNS